MMATSADGASAGRSIVSRPRFGTLEAHQPPRQGRMPWSRDTRGPVSRSPAVECALVGVPSGLSARTRRRGTRRCRCRRLRRCAWSGRPPRRARCSPQHSDWDSPGLANPSRSSVRPGSTVQLVSRPRRRSEGTDTTPLSAPPRGRGRLAGRAARYPRSTARRAAGPGGLQRAAPRQGSCSRRRPGRSLERCRTPLPR